jgi:hypothetical protein
MEGGQRVAAGRGEDEMVCEHVKEIRNVDPDPSSARSSSARTGAGRYL